MENAMAFIREAAWCSEFICQVPTQAVNNGLVNNPRTWGQFPPRFSIPFDRGIALHLHYISDLGKRLKTINLAITFLCFLFIITN